ncbi:putative neuramidase [Candidatus Sulfopaludibacter sp. SbA6]|nr:putative neuramidase [Candidatus Sulfopaludibacter sp. SbA6]
MNPITRRTALLLAAAPALRARKPPLFEQVDLFHHGDDGVHTYRIPSLVETRKGTLLAVVDARHDSASDLPARISLVARRSRDLGKTWSPAVTVRKVEQGGVGDPSLLVDRNSGRIWCFHACGGPGIGFGTAQPGARTGSDTFQWHALHSDDDGVTWSEPVDLTPQVKEPEWQAMFATSGTQIQTSHGRYLVPMVVRHADGVVSSRNAYSDDSGRSWKIGAAIGAGTDESHNVELAGGVILQNMRNGKTRAIARSTDGGVTFSPVTHDAALIDPTCNAGIARYHKRGRDLLIFTNAASARRENLTVKLSADGGNTWTPGRALHPGPAAYSTVAPLHDGSVAVLYECGESNPYERITFARFALEWAEQR